MQFYKSINIFMTIRKCIIHFFFIFKRCLNMKIFSRMLLFNQQLLSSLMNRCGRVCMAVTFTSIYHHLSCRNQSHI